VTDRDAAVDRLHAVPLEEFVAERKRLAKELRAAGDREAATDVAKLPKPSAPAWALNHLAREQPDVVGDWLDAAEALREASADPRATGRDALRAAIATHRDATRQVLAAARDGVRPNGRKLSEPMLERVRELLQAATVDPDEAELLRAGRIVERDEGAEETPASKRAEADEAVRPRRDETEPAARKRAGKDRAEREREAPEREADDRAEREREAKERAAREREAAERAELERLVAAAEERTAELREAVGERERAAATAEERLDEARRALHRSESEAEAARDAVADARDAADDAVRELEALTAELRKAGSS
jgi:chromosome segregation ATPase